MAGDSVVLQPLSDTVPAKLMLFSGVGQGEYTIETSEDQEGWIPVASFKQDHVSVLKWNTVDLELDSPPHYLRIRCLSGTPWLGEAVLKDAEGNTLPASCTEEALIDEQMLAPEKQRFQNSSYFDEIYHVRTAWEHLHTVWPYEISHPPLGKAFISLGIMLLLVTGVLSRPLSFIAGFVIDGMFFLVNLIPFF